MAEANRLMNVNLHQIKIEVNSYELHKHLVIWLLVGGASFGEKTFIVPYDTESKTIKQLN